MNTSTNKVNSFRFSSLFDTLRWVKMQASAHGRTQQSIPVLTDEEMVVDQPPEHNRKRSRVYSIDDESGPEPKMLVTNNDGY